MNPSSINRQIDLKNMRNHTISHDSKGLSLPIDTGGFFMGINEEECREIYI